MPNFAHSDAEAPPTVFLDHNNKIYEEAEWPGRFFRLNFRYAKILINLLICNFFGLIYTKKKHKFCPSGSIM